MKRNHLFNAFIVGLTFAVCLAAVSVRAQGASDHYPFTKGKIVKIDNYAKQIAVNTPHGVASFAVTEKTYLISGLERIGFDKLKIGDSVKVNYSTNETGQASIRRLKVEQAEPGQPEKTK